MPASTVDRVIEMMLSVFRVNGRLLEKGDRLVAGLSLTSARWQVLGAVALAGRPMTAPQIAESMGITRQGAQKQLNLLLAEGLLDRRPNPHHERSPLYDVTPAGRCVFAEVNRLCRLWSADLADGFSDEELTIACRVLSRFLARLDIPLPIDGPAP
jgi:DNA-binding MarR family transcriptional regulator